MGVYLSLHTSRAMVSVPVIFSFSSDGFGGRNSEHGSLAYERAEPGRHMIFGWLQVGEMFCARPARNARLRAGLRSIRMCGTPSSHGHE